jgi:hypothetical protein
VNSNVKVFQFLHIKWFNLLTKITLKNKILLVIDYKMILFINTFMLQKTRNLKFFTRRRYSNSFDFFDSRWVFFKFILPVYLQFAFWNIFRLFGGITFTVSYIFRKLWIFISYKHFLCNYLSLISLGEAIMFILLSNLRRIQISFYLPFLDWIFIFDFKRDKCRKLITILGFLCLLLGA